MIINSVIGGGGSSAVETYITKYDATTSLTLADFFTTFDVRFHYKNSILFLYGYNNNRAPDGNTDYKLGIIAIPNIDNFTNPTGYNIFTIGSSRAAYYWNLLVQGTLTAVDLSTFSANATTGRISTTYANNRFIAKNGSSVIVWEIPVSPLYSDNAGIDTTPWGTT